jgi:hypothetical protein
MEVEKGYSSSDSIAMQQWSSQQRLQTDVAEALKEFDKSDQAYAAFLKAGLNQKQAAAEMDESVVTSRKREARIRKVVSVVLSKVDGCVDVLPWPEENTFDISACADEFSAKFLSGWPEFADSDALGS